MIAVHTALPTPRLREFVRIYAQRKVTAFESGAAKIEEPMPARLEQTLEFQFGEIFKVHHWDGHTQDTHAISIIGAQVNGPTRIELQPGVISFAIFFRPTGYSRLFDLPACELTHRNYDAGLLLSSFSELSTRLAECETFAARVCLVENVLLSLAARCLRANRVLTVAEHIFNLHGAVRISKLAHEAGLSLRQFERNFQRNLGLAPKHFARVARFQTALDTKIAAPDLTWAEIAHRLCYFDQMHMVHDFELLGGAAPHQLFEEIGDARPTALPPQFVTK